MKIIWLGHSSFRIEIEAAALLIDPWLTENPMFSDAQRSAALAGATHVVLTHAHGDHLGEAVEIARAQNIPIVGMNEFIRWLMARDGVQGVAFNKGGTVTLGGAKLTMVNASHSSSVMGENGPVYAGSEAGYMLAGEGHVIYLSGDTDIMADMEWMGDLHNPDIGILSCGGHYTMDMARAAYAAKRYFRFETVIPCHYRTFPALEQSAEKLVAALPDVRVIEPQVMQPITF